MKCEEVKVKIEEESELQKEKELVNLIVNIIVDKIMRDAIEKGYTVFEVQP